MKLTAVNDVEETTESVPVPVTEQRIRNLIKEGAIEVGYMGSKKKYYYNVTRTDEG